MTTSQHDHAGQVDLSASNTMLNKTPLSVAEFVLLTPILQFHSVCTVQGKCHCWSYRLVLEMKENKIKLRQHVSWGAKGQDELWDVMFLACGSE